MLVLITYNSLQLQLYFYNIGGLVVVAIVCCRLSYGQLPLPKGRDVTSNSYMYSSLLKKRVVVVVPLPKGRVVVVT